MATYTIIGGDQKQYNLVTEDNIRNWIAEGRLSEQSLIKVDGDAEFRPLADFPEFARVGVDIQVLGEGLSQPQCGPEVPDEVRAWFGEAGAHQKSFALAPLKEGNLSGLMVLASEDSKRFYPEMGTLYLTWLAQLAGAACARFL